MKVTIAKHAGFCMGVKKAMSMALEASESTTEKIYTLGPLVHNNDAVDMLKQNEVYPANDGDDLSGKKVFIRAHGVPPSVQEELESKCSEIIDATCPYVAKVQRIAKEYSDKGYSVIIAGDHGHAEVEGLLGYCGDNGYIVSNKDDVLALPTLDRVCVIAQTTQNQDRYTQIIHEIEKRIGGVVVEDTICGATRVRQKEVLELDNDVDLVIVVGGRHSANTKRLEELSLETGTPTILIENASQLDENEIKKYSHVGITAGASTPSWVIDNVAKKVESVETVPIAVFLRYIVKFIHYIIDTSAFLGLGAVSLYYSITYFLGIPAFIEIKLPITIFLFISSVHFLNSSVADRIKHGNSIAVIFLIASLILAYLTDGLIFIIHLILCLSGLVYSKIKFSKSLSNTIKVKSLKDIPASKDVFQALAWAIVIVWYASILNGLDVLSVKRTWVATFFVGCIVFTRSIVYDIKDIRLDRLIGKETLPVLLGDKNTKIFLVALLGTLMAGLLYVKARYLHYIKINIFLYSLLYMVTYLFLFHKKIVHKGYSLNLLIDGQFFFAGLVTLLHYV